MRSATESPPTTALRKHAVVLLLAGSRSWLYAGQLPCASGHPVLRRSGRSSPGSNFCLLGDLEGVIDLDTEIPDSRLQLGVAQQQLHGA